MIKKILSLTPLLLLALAINAQILNPVKWSFATKKVGDGLYQVKVQATIEKSWYIYSSASPVGGPLPTNLSFTPGSIRKKHKLTETGTMSEKYEDVFAMKVKYYKDKLELVQLVQVTPGNKMLEGKVEFMTCNGKQCLAPDEVEFSIPLK